MSVDISLTTLSPPVQSTMLKSCLIHVQFLALTLSGHSLLSLYPYEPAHKDGLDHGDHKEELDPPRSLRVRDNDHGFVGRCGRRIGQEEVFQRTKLQAMHRQPDRSGSKGHLRQVIERD